MKKEQNIIVINKQYKVSVLTWLDEQGHEESYEVALFDNGEISYEFRSDVERFETVGQLEEGVQELIADVTAKALSEELKEEVHVEMEGANFIEAWRYRIWTWAVYHHASKEFCWTMETHHEEREQDKGWEEATANLASRKTWRGLVNYIERFLD